MMIHNTEILSFHPDPKRPGVTRAIDVRDGRTIARIAQSGDFWSWSIFQGMWTTDAGEAPSWEAAVEDIEVRYASK